MATAWRFGDFGYEALEAQEQLLSLTDEDLRHKLGSPTSVESIVVEQDELQGLYRQIGNSVPNGTQVKVLRWQHMIFRRRPDAVIVVAFLARDVTGEWRAFQALRFRASEIAF